MRVLLAALALTLAVLAAPAAAAPPWSEPAAVNAPGHPQLQGVEVRYGTGSTGVLSYALGGDGGRAVVPLGVPGGASRDTRVVRSLVAGPLPYGASRTLSIRRRGDVLGYSYGRTSGAVGTFRVLGSIGFLRSVDAAIAPSGHAVVAWVDRDRGVFVAVRRPSSTRFSAPRNVRGSGSHGDVAVGVNDAGRIVVAWEQNGGAGNDGRRVEARLGGTARGTAGLWGLGPSNGFSDIDAVVARTGRTTVAWRTQDGGIELSQPVEVHAAVVPAGRFSFRESQLLARGPAGIERPDGALSVAADASGRATVAFDLNGPFVAGDERTPVQVATQGAGTRFDTVTELVPDGVAGALAVRADGTTVLPVVVQTEEPTTRNSPVMAFVRPPRAFGFAPETVVASGGHGPAAAGFEPGASGRAAVFFATITSGGDLLPRLSIRTG